MTKQEKQLRLFAQWLREMGNNIDLDRDGQMEIAIKYAKQDCMRTIGQYLEEILDMDNEQLKKEF